MKNFFDKLFKGSKAEFFNRLEEALRSEERIFVVTANPETFMLGKSDEAMLELLLSKDSTIVADGIGIVKGGALVGTEIKERIPGVEIAEKLFVLGNKLSKSVFLLGSKPEVLDTLCTALKEKFPKLEIVGAVDGYTDNKDEAFERIKELSPDIILVALGIPTQEKLIYKHLKDFNKGLFVGVGGSFDVLSGTKKRAPEFFIKHNLEWLYRILKEPSRIKRFYNSNIKFIFLLRK